MRPATVKYDEAEYHIIDPGDFYVICAISGATIPLDRLLYWSAEFQEAYAGAEQATEAYLQRNPRVTKQA